MKLLYTRLALSLHRPRFCRSWGRHHVHRLPGGLNVEHYPPDLMTEAELRRRLNAPS